MIRSLGRVAAGVLLGLAVFLPSFNAPRWLGFPRDGFVPPTFLTHALMATLSILVITVLLRRRVGDFGFRRGSFHWSPRYLLWLAPMALLSLLEFLSVGRESVAIVACLKTILFVWIWASIGEEILMRGLVQGYLEPLRRFGFRVLGRWFVSAPVLVAGVMFGLLHVVLWRSIGPMALVPMGLGMILGTVAGYHRERTGSLIPAIFIHALFNVGGSLPLWILSGLTR